MFEGGLVGRVEGCLRVDGLEGVRGGRRVDELEPLKGWMGRRG